MRSKLDCYGFELNARPIAELTSSDSLNMKIKLYAHNISLMFDECQGNKSDDCLCLP